MKIETVNHNHKINKALNLLGEAAGEKKAELKHTFQRFGKVTQKAMADSGLKVKKTVIVADKSVRKNPWIYIGSVAAGALTLGFLLGIVKKK